MEEAADLVAAAGERKDGLRLAERIVHRHREAAFDVRAPPDIRHALELGAQVTVDVRRGERLEHVALALQTRDGLPHLANGSAFEREGRRRNDRLVPELDRA